MPCAWNNGILECWNIGGKSGKKKFKFSKTPLNPSLQYSIIPLFQL
jgi:hypothetical protein